MTNLERKRFVHNKSAAPEGEADGAAPEDEPAAAVGESGRVRLALSGRDCSGASRAAGSSIEVRVRVKLANMLGSKVDTAIMYGRSSGRGGSCTIRLTWL